MKIQTRITKFNYRLALARLDEERPGFIKAMETLRAIEAEDICINAED